MKCTEFGTLADMYIVGELSADTNHEIRAHLDICAACRAERDARIALRDTLRRGFEWSAELAPTSEFGAQVRERVMREPPSRPAIFPAHRRWLAVAASLSVAAFLGWQLARPDTPALLRTLVAHAAGDHRKCALEHSPQQPPISLDDAARRYDSRYAALREIVAQTSLVREGAVEVLAAHWCVFEGTHFAHVVVRHRNHVASILVTPVGASPILEGDDVVACPPTDGFHVACFGARGHAGFVVSDLSDEDNLALARGVVPSLRTLLVSG